MEFDLCVRLNVFNMFLSLTDLLRQRNVGDYPKICKNAEK